MSSGWITTLRNKWQAVPMDVQGGRLNSEELLALPSKQLAEHWTTVRDTDNAYEVRGCYHELYRDFMRGKKVLDVGCGFGISSITFAPVWRDTLLSPTSLNQMSCFARKYASVSGLKLTTS